MRKTDVVKKAALGILIILLLLPLSLYSQDITISGTVTDPEGLSLPGVNILIEGTTRGVASDVDGHYSILAPGDAVLVFNFLGFETLSIPVNNQSHIDVRLRQSYTSLDEIVVVGYGQMRRSDVTGSVVSVSNEAIERSVPTSIDQVLQGRAAGVFVQQNTGTPGGSSSIRIRGINSLNASNEPIFVIDGVIVDGSTESLTTNALASINPSDIVSLDVLKDASASAIYGSRASNGVIIITTKRGVSGEAKINYDGYLGFQELPVRLDLLDLREYALHKNARTDAGIVMPDNFFVRSDLLGKGTDWQKEMFQTAVMHNHNLSVSGGTDQSTYLLSLGYLDQDGVAIGSGFERLSVRANFDSKVKSWLRMGANFTFTNSKQILTVEGESLIKTAMRQTPNVAVRNAQGTFDGPDTDMYVQSNPVGLAKLRENRNEIAGIRSNVYAELDLLPGLVYKAEYSNDFGFTNVYQFNPTFKFGALENKIASSDRSKSYNKYYAIRNLLTYKNNFNDIHNLDLMLGHEMQKSGWEYLRGSRTGFLSNTARDLTLGDGTTSVADGNSGDHAILSFFGRAFYNFDDRYMLTTTLRYDGSSNFAKNNRWGLFPSAAFAWRISNESFLKNIDEIENLRLRIGWGTIGNQNIRQRFAYTSTLSPVTTVWGTGQLSGNMANPELKWESTYSTNLGLDLSLFRGRIELIAEAYYKETKDLLLELPLPAYLGTDGQGSVNPPWANIGSLENKGLEFTLNTVNIDRGGFQWRSNLVYSLNRNKVLKLDTETSTLPKRIQEGSDITIVTQTFVGKPIGLFYGYRVIGRFDKATDFYYKDADGIIKEIARPEDIEISETGVYIGDYIFKDINGDGVINDSDRTIIGNPEPKFTFGIGNTFSYRGFDLNIYLMGVYGNDVVNYQRRWSENPRENHNLLRKALNYAIIEKLDPDGPDDYRNLHVVGGDDDMHRLSSSQSNANNRMSDKYIEDGSFLRIQNVSLAYNFPRSWVENLGLGHVKIYANLQNLYTFTKYSGYDPEIGAYNQDVLLTGIDNARYPSPRIYTFGVNVSF